MLCKEKIKGNVYKYLKSCLFYEKNTYCIVIIQILSYRFEELS